MVGGGAGVATACEEESMSALELALVSLIAVLEGELRERTGRAVALVDESGLDPESSPFRTLSTLTAHVARFLAEPLA